MPAAESQTLVGQIAFNLRFELLFTACTIVFWVVTSAIRRGNQSKAPCKVVEEPEAFSAFQESKPKKARQPLGTAIAALKQVITPDGIAIIKRGAGPDDVIRSYESAARSDGVLSTLSHEALNELFAQVFSAAVRCGRVSKLPQYLKDSTKLGLDISPQQLESIVKMCAAKKNFREALAAFDACGIDPSDAKAGTASIWSCLLFCSVEVGAFDRCHALYKSILKMREPSNEDFVNMIRSIARTQNSALLCQVLQELRESKFALDNLGYNRGLAVCITEGQQSMAEAMLCEMQRHEGVCDVITYNTLLKGYSQAGEIDKCFALQNQMKTMGIRPSDVTFGILLNSCLGAKQPDRAAQVFKEFQASGCKLNAVLYTTLIKGLSQAGQLDEAMDVFEQMCASDVAPDLVAFSVLMKVFCDAGKVEVALQLFERLLQQGLTPDEIVFNNLLSGCVERQNSALGNRIFSDMQKHNLWPSHVTLSIMVKLLSKCREWDAALELINTSPEKLGLNRESRLYLQLAQQCIRDRQGKRAPVIVEALLRHCSLDEAGAGRLLQQCVMLNMFDTGVEILELFVLHKSKFSARDVNAMLAGAVKKRKAQIVATIIKVMEKAGIPIDSKLRDA